MTDRLSPDIPRYVVSFGGCGSKLMTRLLYPGAPAGYLDRAHVHWRHPPENASGHRFVYMFGDPRDTVVSFFQRRESRHDRHGFGASASAGTSAPAFVRRAMSNLESPHPPIPERWDVSDYLAGARVDVFALEDHFDQWLARARSLDVLFVGYEALWSSPDVLHRELAIDLSTIPPRVPRRANWQLLSAVDRERLDGILGAFATRLSGLPRVFRAGDVG